MSRFDPEALPKTGEQVDRYRVLMPVAQGGMAAVYAVRRQDDHGFDKLLAMKLMLPHLAEDQHFVDMFMDEARIAAQVQHPNVVSVFDVGIHRRLPFLVMEFLRGQSLAQLLKRTWYCEHPTLSAPLVYHILAETAAGLHAAHTTKSIDGAPLHVVHRDVSPQNVHVGYDGSVRVVDFGIAAARGRLVTTRTGEIKGKLAYLAPELLHRRFEVDHRADLWALGVMAFEVLSRRRLFKTNTEAETLWNILNKPVPRVREVVSDVEASVCDVVEECLARIPDDRPPNAAVVAEVFRNAAGGGLPAEDLGRLMSSRFVEEEGSADAALRSALAKTSKSRFPPAGSGSDRATTRWAVVAAVGAIALVGSFAFVYGQADSPPPAASQEPPSNTADSRSAALPEPEEPTEELRAVTLQVDEAVRMVLIDRELHPERPVSLELSPTGQATVLLIGRDDQESERIVSVDDDGTVLMMPRVIPPPSSRDTPRRGTKSGRDRRATMENETMRVVMGQDGLLSIPLDMSR